MTPTNLVLLSSDVDEQQRQQLKQTLLENEKQYIDLLLCIDKKLKGKGQYTPFKDWLAAAKVLEKVHQVLYNKLDTSGQDNGIMDIMIEWGTTIESPYAYYIRAYTPIQKQHGTLLCASIKTVIKALPTTSPFSSIDGLLAAPFDQLKLYQSIYQNSLDSPKSSKQQNLLKKIIHTIDTLLKQHPPRMVDSASSNDLQSFQKFVDCDHVIDLFTKNQLDYQLRSRPGRILLKDDFLLLADNNDQPALRIHMVLTTDILMICKQMMESTGRYDLLYPPLAVNDITVQPLMLDRELIGEYTLEFTVLNKNLIVRAESREIRNAWIGMPLTTTAKNAIKTRVSLTNVVREAGNNNNNATLNSSNNKSTVTLDSTINNRKSNIGVLYGSTDISPVESSEDDDDDDDDDDDSDDDDSDDSDGSTSSGHIRQSLVAKKSLPSVPAPQLSPPKKDNVAPPPQELATPMINVSLHGDNNIKSNQVPGSKENHYNKHRGSSARVPLPNPASNMTPAALDSKPLPRSTSNRTRQTGSVSQGPRPPMPPTNQSPMMMMMQRPQQHQMHHPQHSKQLPSPSSSSSSSRQHQHRTTSHGVNGIPTHPSHQNAPNRPRMMGPPQPQSSVRPNSSLQRPPPSSHQQFQQRPPFINHSQQRTPQNHTSQQRVTQQRSSQYHQQPQQRPSHHHPHQTQQQRSSQHHPSHQRPPQQRPPQQRSGQHHQRPPPHFQNQQRPSPPPPQHHHLNPNHPQLPAPTPTNVTKPLPQTTATAPAQAAMIRPDSNASLQRPMPPTPPPQKNQFSSLPNQESSPQSPLPIPPPIAQESVGSSLHLSPEELATPPRSPNPYNNQTNGIRQVLFRNQQCEVFRWKDESWYAVDGQCLLEVRQTFTNRSCVAIRVQTTGELYLNAWVLPQTQIRLASSTDVSLGLIMGSQQETYLVHFEQSTDATELNQVLQKMHHAAVVASRQPNDGQQTLRGEPPTEMMTGMQPEDDEDYDDDDDGDNAVMMDQGSAISATTMNGHRRSSSLMQSGQETVAVPQTLQPAMKCKCKLFVQNEHSNWSSFGSVQLVVSLQVPSRRMHIQIDHDKKRGFSKIIPTGNTSPSGSPSTPSTTSLSSTLSPDNGSDATAATTTSASTLVSATVYSNNVERLNSKRISFLLVNEQERTSSMVYMVQLREEESGNTLYDYLKTKNSQNGW